MYDEGTRPTRAEAERDELETALERGVATMHYLEPGEDPYEGVCGAGTDVGGRYGLLLSSDPDDVTCTECRRKADLPERCVEYGTTWRPSDRPGRCPLCEHDDHVDGVCGRLDPWGLDERCTCETVLCACGDMIDADESAPAHDDCTAAHCDDCATECHLCGPEIARDRADDLALSYALGR